MVPYSIDLVTAIAISLIITILAVYLSILKKYGWIGEPSNYRCPNPQCKTIFQTPLKVKGFSNKSEVHFACPECGCDLGLLKDKNGLSEISLQGKSKLKIRDSDLKAIETEVSMTNRFSGEAKPLGASAPIVDSEENRVPQETNHVVSLKQKLDDPKKDGSAFCNHYFGYLGGIQKDTENLDECYFCPRLLECSKKVGN